MTGATFVIFSGALKASSPGMKCKTSIVEDGLMIQLLPSVLEEVKQALLNRTDFSIQSAKNSGQEGTEELAIRWVDSQPNSAIQYVLIMYSATQYVLCILLYNAYSVFCYTVCVVYSAIQYV